MKPFLIETEGKTKAKDPRLHPTKVTKATGSLHIREKGASLANGWTVSSTTYCERTRKTWSVEETVQMLGKHRNIIYEKPFNFLYSTHNRQSKVRGIEYIHTTSP